MDLNSDRVTNTLIKLSHNCWPQTTNALNFFDFLMVCGNRAIKWKLFDCVFLPCFESFYLVFQFNKLELYNLIYMVEELNILRCIAC